MTLLIPRQAGILKPFDEPPLAMRLDRSHPLSVGLMVRFAMSGGSGRLLRDHSGRGNHGAMSGGYNTTDRVLRFQAASSHYFDLPSQADVNPSDITIAMRCYAPTLGVLQNVLTKHTTTDPCKGWVVYLDTDDRLYTQAGNGGAWPTYNMNVGPLGAAGFYWVFVSYTASERRLDVKPDGGDWLTPATGGASPYLASTSNAWFGRNAATPSSYYDGQIKDLLIYNRALSDEERNWIVREPYCMFQAYSHRAISAPVFMDADISTAFTDMPLDIEIQSWGLVDVPLDVEIWGDLFSDIPLDIEVAGSLFTDLPLDIEVVDGVFFTDLPLDMEITDGVFFTDLPLEIEIVAPTPAFRSVVAQRLLSVMHEVA